MFTPLLTSDPAGFGLKRLGLTHRDFDQFEFGDDTGILRGDGVANRT